MLMMSLKVILLGVFVILDTGVHGAQYPYEFEDGAEDASNHREGKIFNRRFWDGFERGLKGTADIFSRVSDNLEVAFDQIANDFTDNLSTFADKIERRVGGSLPPYLRENPNQPLQIDAIGGVIGGGVDDGLKVYYPKKDAEGGAEEDSFYAGSSSDASAMSGPDGTPSRDPFGGVDLDTDAFNPFGNFGGSGGGLFNIFRRRRPWWQGNNVCVDREEIDDTETNTKDGVKVEDEVEIREVTTTDSNKPTFNFLSNLQMSSCKDVGDKYSCVTSTTRRGIHKTVKVTYRCCHGFVRDGSGCTKVDIFPMAETLENLGAASDFLSLIKAADLIDTLNNSNLTIFVPNKEAIAEFTADLEDKNEIPNNIDGLRNDIYRRKRETHKLADTILGHMTEGFLYAGDFSDEMMMSSLNEKSSLRMNIYSGFPPSVTVNCARIVKANQHSMNGVVHTIDRVIRPVYKSIAEIIATDPQFTILKQLLGNSGLIEELSSDGQFTFFAPTDTAFRRLKPMVLESLLEGSSCLEAVIKQHILPNTICSTAIQGKMKTLTQLDEYLIVERREDDKIFVDEAEIVATDIVGTNGVVHIIDNPLIPNEAKSVNEVLEFHNLTKFMELLELAELSEEFNKRSDISVFAPSNAAIQRIPEEELNALKTNKEKLREALRYHLTVPSVRANSLNNNQLVDTAAGHPLRINLYSGAPFLSGLLRAQTRRPMKITAGCSRVSVLDSRACGAVVHIVEDMLNVPKSNILDVLNNEEKFSIFKQMILDTGINKELEGEGPYTLLVPSDHALKTLPEEELNDIMKSEKLKEQIVRKHIMKEHVCCSGINSNNWLFMDRKRTVDGSNIHIRRSPSGKLMAGSARIIECGSPTANGVVHTVNRMVVDDRDIGGMPGHEGGGRDGLRIFTVPNFGNIFF